MQQHLDVLLVEDNPGEAELTLHALRAAGGIETVEHVSDGEQALDRMFGRAAYFDCPRRPRLIVLDLKMPRMDGFEVLRQLRADDRTCGIPVVVFSSSAGDLDIERCHSLGATGFVQKPACAMEFRDAVRSIVHRWLPSAQESPAR